MIRVCFKPEVSVQKSSDGLFFSTPEEEVKWKAPHPFLKDLLRLLKKGIPEKKMEQSSEPLFHFFIERFFRYRFLCYQVLKGSKILATLVPSNQEFRLSEKEPSIKKLSLSRFAYLRKNGESFALESPLSASILYLKDPSCLRAPPPILFELLYRASFLSDEDQKLSLATWEFHDLLFHARSRKGRHPYPLGGTFRFSSQIPPLPAIRETPPDSLILLTKPDLEKRDSLPFSRVLEERRSIKEQGPDPLSQEQLGELLFRAARVKEHRKGEHYEVTRRPYPGGGKCYELEIYPLIHRCQGLKQGLYRYHPESHALCPIRDWDENVERLCQGIASVTDGGKILPQVVLLIAARFKRVSWKYESIAYSLMLKNSGHLLQTLYLVATEMGLAPSAIGSGDSDLFSKITGIDYYEETTIAEFILGTRS